MKIEQAGVSPDDPLAIGGQLVDKGIYLLSISIDRLLRISVPDKDNVDSLGEVRFTDQRGYRQAAKLGNPLATQQRGVEVFPLPHLSGDRAGIVSNSRGAAAWSKQRR